MIHALVAARPIGRAGFRRSAAFVTTVLIGALSPALHAQAVVAAPPPAYSVDGPAQGDTLARNADMARRMYEPQLNSRWALGKWPSSYTADGKPRPEWRISTWGPVNRESGFTTTGGGDRGYSDEFLMYWKAMPDFRITHYTVWPTAQGWIARIIYEGTTREGQKALAHQVDIVTVDDSGKVTRIEWHCDAGEWIDQVWTKASGLTAAQVRDVLKRPSGFNVLTDIALGKAKY